MNKLGALISRNAKIYLRDRAAVFFSFLSVLIVFFLYILFIGKNIKTGLENAFLRNGLNADLKLINLYSDSWTMGGIIGVGCVTVANGCMANFVHDTMLNLRNDLFVTPTSRVLIITSYFFSTLIITVVMNALMFVIIYAYLLIKGMAALAFMDLLAILGIITLSAISATILSLLLSFFVKTDSAHAGVVAIFTVLAGFATGAYMPLSFFPKAITYICTFYPATGTVVLMRNYIMKSVISEMSSQYPVPIVSALKEEYALFLKIGSWSIPNYLIVVYVLATTLILGGALALLIRKYKNK